MRVFYKRKFSGKKAIIGLFTIALFFAESNKALASIDVDTAFSNAGLKTEKTGSISKILKDRMKTMLYNGNNDGRMQELQLPDAMREGYGVFYYPVIIDNNTENNKWQYDSRLYPLYFD